MRVVIVPAALLACSACAQVANVLSGPDMTAPSSAPDSGVETAVLAAPPPPPAARTVEQFDTTTQEQRAAVSQPADGGTRLGDTVASLGDATRSGFWAETPLVSERTTGRLEYPAAATSVEVELIPSGEAAGAGSRVSLAAFRVLEAPLTDLPTLIVYAD